MEGASSPTEKDSKNDDVCFEAPPQHVEENDDEHLVEVGTKSMPEIENYCTLSVQNVTLQEEDPDELDIAYLKMKFPDISEQSLRDIYAVNDDDLDDAIDMLSQLQFDGDIDKSLPKTMGVGDVSENGSSHDPSSPKLKNTEAEASASSNPMPSSPNKS